MPFLGRERVADPAGAPKPLTVSELNKRVRTLLENELPRVWVEGAVSRPVLAASGHLYFGLQDDGGRVDAVMWAQRARALPFRPVDGLQVRARGAVTVYPPSGKYQLVADELELAGEGAREKRLRLLREKLKAEGLFDPARKRPLPALPRCIALVTSPTGAALRDLFRVILRRFPPARILVVPVRVQGDGAAEEIAEGVRRATARPDVDVLVVGRGGGSVEDLWAFNEECVARAIFGSPVPVVSAVGHEIDVTVADDVADLRAATPSEAGERVAPLLGELLETLDDGLRRLRAGVVRAARAAREAAVAAGARRAWNL
ncbi:MAG TPA: exodeoxyribonuclease VII large subunit, partial [Planctomycetota bacterium]|nr:exodeoxyribonuclease VII large subunit [Planctomycetota bacterium]